MTEARTSGEVATLRGKGTMKQGGVQFEEQDNLHSVELSPLDFLVLRRPRQHASLGPNCAFLSGPPHCVRGKTSLLLQLAYNIALVALNRVVFICKPRNFENDYIYLAQEMDTEVLDRIHIKYVNDDEELRKYFAAFHMHQDLPTAVIVDDFIDLFNSWAGRQQDGQTRSSRELAMVKTLCLGHSAITYANEKLKSSVQCTLIVSDSHPGDAPRLLYIFRRWLPQIFVIKTVDGLSTFTLQVDGNRTCKKNVPVAKYTLAQQAIYFDGWETLLY